MGRLSTHQGERHHREEGEHAAARLGCQMRTCKCAGVALDGRECRRGRDEADTASLPKRKLIKCNQGLIQSRRLRQLRRLRARHSVGERGKTWSPLAWVDFDWSGA